MFALASPVLFYFFGILKENEKGDLKMIKRVRLDFKPVAKRTSEEAAFVVSAEHVAAINKSIEKKLKKIRENEKRAKKRRENIL